MAFLTTQTNLDVTINTPLGPDTLIVDRFEGVEGISMPYEFVVDLHSRSHSIDFDALVGKDIQVAFSCGGKKRYFAGIVGEFRQQGTFKDNPTYAVFYQIKVYPRFWLLKFNKDHRIFQNQSALDIIKATLGENGVTDIQDKTESCGKGVREYCVQYGESAFDFASRLMEEEGIFYYFSHSESGHTMVLADDNGACEPCAEGDVELAAAQTSEPLLNQIQSCDIQQQIVSKKFATADYNFTKAATKLYSKVEGVGVGGEVYTYPGKFETVGDGETVAHHGIQELEWPKLLAKGYSTVPFFTPGYMFTLKGHLRASANQKYLLYKVRHQLNIQAERGQKIYENDFIAFPSSVSFRPPLITSKPRIHGTQTAVVTTKSGEEIWSDEYGRIKVKFHWDQRGSNDETSSCWIRVAQIWAASNWGGVFIPRVGQEVIVAYLEGDPDRPLITGCVYNSDNTPPYLPDEPTKSTIKSNSSKGGGGYNEIYFEDKKGKEELYIQAEKDMYQYIKGERASQIDTGDDTTTVSKGNCMITVPGPPPGGNLMVTLANNLVAAIGGGLMITMGGAPPPPPPKKHSGGGIGGGAGAAADGQEQKQEEKPTNHILDIVKWGDSTVHIKKGHQFHNLDEGNQETTLKKGDQIATLVEGNRTVTLNKGNQVVTLQEGDDIKTLTKGNCIINLKEGNLTIKVKGAISIEADDAITVKTKQAMKLVSSGDMTLESQQNLTIKAAMNINIKAGMNISAKADMNLQGEAGVNFEAKGGVDAKVKGGATANLEAGGVTSVKGTLVKLN